MLSFTVLGEPAPQGSKSVGRNGQLYESSKKVAPWRRAVKAKVSELSFTPFDQPVEILVMFYLTRPRSVKRILPSIPPDLDKLERGLFDALTQAGVWADDSLVVKSSTAKLYADTHPAGAVITIRECTDLPLAIMATR